MSSNDDYVPLTIPSTSPGFVFSPADAWDALSAPGATNGQAEFLLGDTVNGRANAFITYTFPEAATALQYWGYQRSDGGLFSICFDCAPSVLTGAQQIDALNTSVNGSEPPRLLFQTTSLSYAVHNLTLTNLFDSRATIGGATAGAYGQMTFDRFVLFAPSTPPTSTANSTSPPTSTPTPPCSPCSPPSDTSTSSPTGAIAGGVVGGLALLALLAFLIWFFLRRRSRLRPYHTPSMDLGEEGKVVGIGPLGPQGMDASGAVQPFVLGVSDASGAGGQQQQPMGYTYAEYQGFAPSTSAPSTTSARPLPNPYPAPIPIPPAVGPPSIRSQKLRQQRSPFPVSRPTDPSNTNASPTQAPISPSVYPVSDSSGSSTAPLRPQQQPRRETDAGWLAGDDGQEEEGEGGQGEAVVLPPDYEDAVRRRREGVGR